MSENLNNHREKFGDFRHFEHLLSEISAKYINMPIEELESTVSIDFGQLADLLGCDSCNFHIFDQEKQNWLTLFESSEKVFLWARKDKFARQLRKLRDQPNFAEKMKYMFERWDSGSFVICPCPNEKSRKVKEMEEFVFSHGINSFISVPIFAAGAKVGAIVIATHGRNCVWHEGIVSTLRLFGEIFANALVRKRTEESLRAALSEVQRLLSDIKQLKDQIEADYVYLTEEINLEHGFPGVVGKSQVLRQMLLKVKQVAPTNATVLLLGETGTGKNIIARAIHNESDRSHRPLIQVNCSAFAPGLIESELFGHEKGAFTGAVTRRIGRFEIANRTTLFLDEIGDLPLNLQGKLLRVLQEGEFERLGGNTTIKSDVRVIAATNTELQEEVDNRNFRKDLWYRLNVFPIRVPPLRERADDIPLLINFFIKKYKREFGKSFNKVSNKAVKALQAYHWPGNIRELQNCIERAIISSPNGNLQLEPPLSVHPKSLFDMRRKYQEFERKVILDALEKTNWMIEGPHGAASIAGFKPSTFRLHMKKLGIKRPGRR